MKKRVGLCAACMVLSAVGMAQAATSDSLDIYEIDPITVRAQGERDIFGNTITEQSYYRTGGDATIIDSETIERNHFAELSDALKRVPGVWVKGPGYRGGEYGYEQTHSVVSINGDDRVVILVDGRRVDNSVGEMIGSMGSRASKSTVDINQVVDMNNVQTIEVIKGSGAAVYGADAIGGVINIITKKGTEKPSGSLELSMGSWGRVHGHGLLSGSDDSGRLSYVLSGSWEKGGNSRYHDRQTGKDYTYFNTYYNEKSASVQLDYKVNDEDSIHFSYSHRNARNGYPLTAPDHRYFNETDWRRILTDYADNNKYGDERNPGYRTLWYLWTVTGAHSDYYKNNYDLSYNFGKDGPIERYIRLYDQSGTYSGSFGGGDGDKMAPVPETPELFDWARKKDVGRGRKSWIHNEHNYGIQVQWGKQYGQHSVITMWTFDRSEHDSYSRRSKRFVTTERDTLVGVLQDKIDLSDRWQITPSLRYTRYSSMERQDDKGVSFVSGDSASALTGALYTQYAFSPMSSIYASWTQIYSPLKRGDIESAKNKGKPVQLNPDKGNAFSIGLRHAFSNKTEASIHYAFTNMSNAAARYSVWDNDEKNFVLRYVNAKQDKKAINMNVNHRFDDNWRISLSYAHMKDKWKVADGDAFDEDLQVAKGNVNTAINRLRPANLYTMNLNYERGKFNADLFVNWYTGCNPSAYTSNSFCVADLSLNYDFRQDFGMYLKVTNLTNEGWENVYTRYLGKGSWPQPGRAFMLGAKYTF